MDRKQKRRSNKPLGNSIQLAHVLGSGSNKIKKKIRDIERLLQKKKDTLPDTVLIDKERALEALKLELKNAELRVTAQNNAKKYHMVRFFERKKALRKYNQALKSGDKSETQERAVDLCYVVNFPKTEKYIALYPSEENDQGSEKKKSKHGIEKTDADRASYRELVAAQMESGDLPVSLSKILKGGKLERDDNGIQLKEAGEADSAGDKEDEEEDDFFE
ncbi:LANO_0C08812g1_1 [Lachancea nothofagi CBS 11611]|uniref:rRNA-processing protein EFG1 n=1 Tax=Lachancea nothofagi CBS 11611 TaxID=1266666 RepID=A0A1G4J9G5_9SACH|nr:LANO_0C08812g1_1 [Lachancea nothofagi CBS 11611]